MPAHHAPLRALVAAWITGCAIEAPVTPPEAPLAPPEAPVAPPEANACERVELGIDVLLEPGSEHAALLAGKRVGLITNPSGVDGALVPSADRLARDGRVQLVQLFGPEHGIRGAAAANATIVDERDPVTGIPVESLFGARTRPSPETLAGLDVVLFDIQDIGSRTYTYVSTLGEAMVACADAQVQLVVLDRPNPIGGVLVEGAVIEDRHRSFIGWGPTPVTHGMTVGELARLYEEALDIDCDLHIVPMRHWTRDMVWEDTGLTWTPTSPHVPHALQAHLYVTTGMVAATTRGVSEGVGTTMPFELIAARYIDGPRLARELSTLDLPGVRFQALAVEPFYGGFAGEHLEGVRLVLDDPHAYRPLHTSLAILTTLRALHPEDLRLRDEAVVGMHWGNTRLIEQLDSGASVDDIERSWAPTRAAFDELRAVTMIYR